MVFKYPRCVFVFTIILSCTVLIESAIPGFLDMLIFVAERKTIGIGYSNMQMEDCLYQQQKQIYRLINLLFLLFPEGIL